MTELLTELGNLTPTVAMSVIMVGLYIFLVKREEREKEFERQRQERETARQEKKDEMYIQTLANIQGDLKSNWELTRVIAENQQKTTQALGSLKCLQR